MEGSSAGGGRRGCCEDACPWEREEAASLAWDRRLRELSQSDVVRLIGASVERGDMPPIAAELLECDTCRIPWADPARWGRLVGVIRDYLVTETGLVVVDSPEELAKAEVLLFSDRDVEARRRLARGLVGQVWRRQPPTRAPWHSRLMQLVRDIDVCCFMLRLLLSRCTITMEPLVTPYCDVDAVADAFRQSDSADEAAWSPYIEGGLIYRLAARGFITIAYRVDAPGFSRRLLVPKMHVKRSFLKPAWIRMSRRGKRAARSLRVTTDTAFHRVISGIVQQHGENWMYPEMQAEFNRMHYQRHRFGALETTLHSIEVWSGSELVAGEIGFATGAVYTSVTGFHTLSSSGTFQLYALAAILHFQGIELWDLGMDIPYKRDLGAHLMHRTRFINEFNRSRAKERTLQVPQRFQNCDNGVTLLEEFAAAQKGCEMDL